MGFSSGSALFSRREHDASYTAGSPTLAPLLVSFQKPFEIKTLLVTQHVVDAPSELGGQNGKSLALAVLRLKSPGHLLALLAVTKEKTCGFGEGPLEVGIALFPSRAVFGLHESRVGDKVLNSRKATDVVDLVEDRKGQALPIPGTDLKRW